MRTTDLNYLRNICDNDQKFIKEMIVTFLEMTPMLLAQMQILSKENKWQELAKTAHQLKPSLQFMGMAPARDKVKQIEDLCGDNPEYIAVAKFLKSIEKDCNRAYSELNGVMKNGFVSV